MRLLHQEVPPTTDKPPKRAKNSIPRVLAGCTHSATPKDTCPMGSVLSTGKNQLYHYYTILAGLLNAHRASQGYILHDGKRMQFCAYHIFYVMEISVASTKSTISAYQTAKSGCHQEEEAAYDNPPARNT